MKNIIFKNMMPFPKVIHTQLYQCWGLIFLDLHKQGQINLDFVYNYLEGTNSKYFKGHRSLQFASI